MHTYRYCPDHKLATGSKQDKRALAVLHTAAPIHSLQYTHCRFVCLSLANLREIAVNPFTELRGNMLHLLASEHRYLLSSDASRCNILPLFTSNASATLPGSHSTTILLPLASECASTHAIVSPLSSHFNTHSILLLLPLIQCSSIRPLLTSHRCAHSLMLLLSSTAHLCKHAHTTCMRLSAKFNPGVTVHTSVLHQWLKLL